VRSVTAIGVLPAAWPLCQGLAQADCTAAAGPAVLGGLFARLGQRMAGPLAAMERFFERLFERPAARLLAPRLEAVHLQRHLERAMEDGRVRRAGKWHVQARYRLLLHPADLVALSGRDTLPSELAETLRDHARRRGYVLETRTSVRLEASPRVSSGQAVVLADDLSSVGAGQPSLPAPEAPAEAPTDRPGADSDAPTPSHDPGPGESQTSVFRANRPASPRATIAVRAPGEDARRIPVGGGQLRIGRGSDNDIVLADSRVSRHHAQISVRLGTLIYTDLGSTNGSYLQGSRVQEIALGPHDVIQLGGSSLTIEPAAD
jgi:hypothetical protein